VYFGGIIKNYGEIVAASPRIIAERYLDIQPERGWIDP